MAAAVVTLDETAKIRRITWTLTNADPTGDAVSYTDFADRSVQATGTFGGSTITIEGSNDGTTYATLTDNQNTAVTFTVPSIQSIEDLTLLIRPVLSGGAGSTVVVTLLVRMP